MEYLELSSLSVWIPFTHGQNYRLSQYNLKFRLDDKHMEMSVTTFHLVRRNAENAYGVWRTMLNSILLHCIISPHEICEHIRNAIDMKRNE